MTKSPVVKVLILLAFLELLAGAAVSNPEARANDLAARIAATTA